MKNHALELIWMSENTGGRSGNIIEIVLIKPCHKVYEHHAIR
jgi:hypothetical protein